MPAQSLSGAGVAGAASALQPLDAREIAHDSQADDDAEADDAPEGPGLVRIGNALHVHPEEAGDEGERQEDERDDGEQQRALIELLRSKVGNLFVQEGGYLSDILGANLTSVLAGFEEAR